MRTVAVLALVSVQALAWQSDISHLIADTGVALDKNDLISAADLAARLDRAVQEKYEFWLVRDATQRIEETLTWLPENTEAFWVSKTPFVADLERPDVLQGQPWQIYATDRLRAIEGGAVWKRLQGKTIRIVACGARDIRPTSYSIPASAPQADSVYFYFLAEPTDLSAFPIPDLKVSGKPVWSAPGLHEDNHWYALARPDLLVLATGRGALTSVLERMTSGSRGRALPATVSEWKLVNWSAGFWGLRHSLSGAAVSYDNANERLEIRQFTDLTPEDAARDRSIGNQFQFDRPEPGVLRSKSDIKARGDFPFHYGMTLLGMGEYR
jgi:hypothetical protein